MTSLYSFYISTLCFQDNADTNEEDYDDESYLTASKVSNRGKLQDKFRPRHFHPPKSPKTMVVGNKFLNILVEKYFFIH